MGFLIHRHRSVTVQSSREHGFSSLALGRRASQPQRADHTCLTVRLTDSSQSQWQSATRRPSSGFHSRSPPTRSFCRPSSASLARRPSQPIVTAGRPAHTPGRPPNFAAECCHNGSWIFPASRASAAGGRSRLAYTAVVRRRHDCKSHLQDEKSHRSRAPQKPQRG